MNGMDTVSHMLGEIQSDLKHAVKWMEEHEQRDEERHKDIIQRIDDLDRNSLRIDNVEGKVEVIEPVIEGVKRAKWVAAGILAGLGVASGSVGAAMVKFLS